jgi:RNA polymerase sigma factor (sigma-70 family)
MEFRGWPRIHVLCRVARNERAGRDPGRKDRARRWRRYFTEKLGTFRALLVLLRDQCRNLTRGMAAATLEQEPDRRLVERFLAQRDEAAFEALTRRHGPMVYRVCWRVLQQPQDVEDAFQATFLVLARQPASIRKLASVASWLHGVARRVALKAKAHAVKAERRPSMPGSLAGPADETTWKELRTILDDELAQLPEKWRAPLILCYLEGRTQDEAAGQLTWSKNTLRRRLDEARTALGRRLRRRGIVGPATLAAALLSDCAVSAAVPGVC